MDFDCGFILNILLSEYSSQSSALTTGSAIFVSLEKDQLNIYKSVTA